MNIENLATDILIPYARNAKLHNNEQVSAIAGSIKEFGFNNPILIDANNGIIAGHGRLLAARKLGMETVPCIRIGHLSDAQRRAYILADNRLAEIGGGWDKEMIALELIEIKEDGLDIDLTGFDDLLDQAPVRVDAVDSIKEECCLQIVCKNWDERTEAESILGGRKIAWADLRKLSKI